MNRHELLDALAAMTDDELTHTVAEARTPTADDAAPMRAFARNLFATSTPRHSLTPNQETAQ